MTATLLARDHPAFGEILDPTAYAVWFYRVLRLTEYILDSGTPPTVRRKALRIRERMLELQ